MGAAIELKDVWKSYGDLIAVEGVSFDVMKGEVFCLLGPNGAGKTTTMRMIVGILPPDRGRIEVNGLDVREDPVGVKEMIGYLPEFPVLYPRLTLRENLEFFGALYGLRGSELDCRLRDLMVALEVIDLIDRRFETLSKGQKQRASLIRTLLHDPSVLVLDEPTAGLDPVSAVAIRELVVELGREGKAILMSTHNMLEASTVCDRIALIRRRIVAHGNKEDIVSLVGSGRYVVRIVGNAGEYVGALRGVARVVGVSGSEIVLKLDDFEEQAPRVIERLVSVGARIISAVPEEPSLEEVFIRLVGEDEG